MNQLTTKFDIATGDNNGTRSPVAPSLADSLVRVLIRLGILKEDLDYHLIRASMVIIFLFFGYQKWFEYEAQVLTPISATARLFSGCTRFSGSVAPLGFLGVSEWSFGTLLFLGFWNKKLGIFGAL